MRKGNENCSSKPCRRKVWACICLPFWYRLDCVPLPSRSLPTSLCASPLRTQPPSHSRRGMPQRAAGFVCVQDRVGFLTFGQCCLENVWAVSLASVDGSSWCTTNPRLGLTGCLLVSAPLMSTLNDYHLWVWKGRDVFGKKIILLCNECLKFLCSSVVSPEVCAEAERVCVCLKSKISLWIISCVGIAGSSSAGTYLFLIEKTVRILLCQLSASLVIRC